jgi:hypothetical protein
MKRKRVILDDIAFDFTFPSDSSGSSQEMDIHNCNNASLVKGNDIFHFRIQFDPSITKLQANSSSLRVTFLPGKKSYCHIVVLPSTDRKETQSLGDMKFIVFETHAIQLDGKGNVFCIWLTLENNLLRAPTKNDPREPFPVLQPSVDPCFFMQDAFGKERYKGLSFFPPSDEFDKDSLAQLELDSTQIPQRIPLW